MVSSVAFILLQMALYNKILDTPGQSVLMLWPNLIKYFNQSWIQNTMEKEHCVQSDKEQRAAKQQ